MSKGLDPALLTDPGNLGELCTHHHEKTTASLNHKYLSENPKQAKEKPEPKKREKAKTMRKVKRTRCSAETGSGLMRGGRCRLHAVSGSEFCHVHNQSRRG